MHLIPWGKSNTFVNLEVFQLRLVFLPVSFINRDATQFWQRAAGKDSKKFHTHFPYTKQFETFDAKSLLGYKPGKARGSKRERKRKEKETKKLNINCFHLKLSWRNTCMVTIMGTVQIFDSKRQNKVKTRIPLDAASMSFLAFGYCCLLDAYTCCFEEPGIHP